MRLFSNKSKEVKEVIVKEVVFDKNEKLFLEMLHKCNLKEATWIKDDSFTCHYNDLICSFHWYSIDNCFIVIKRSDGQKILSQSISENKRNIIINIFKDKVTAYSNDLIISNLHNKKLNDDSCPYCGTKNSKEKTNCINCGAVI